MTMSPVSAAVAGALISGVVMYTVGERSQKVDAFAQPPAYVQTVDGRIVPVTPAQPTGFVNGVQPMALQPVALQPAAAQPAVIQRPARQTVYRTQPVQERVVVEREPVRSGRSWQKTAMIIGGSAAGGAGVGGIAGGKKGALIGAAIGGGAASIYEATRRR
jgi:hypothetical protein